MRIEIENVFAWIRDFTPDEIVWVRDWLTFRQERYNPKTKRMSGAKVCMLNGRHGFPAGLVLKMQKSAAKAGIAVMLDDRRVRPCGVNPNADLAWLRDYQLEAIHACTENERGIIWASTGCHAKGQRVLLADGQSIAVENVLPGDNLMGPEGVRTVLNLCRGRQRMAKIVPVKGEPWVVNLDHVLSLVHTTSGATIDVSVRDWMTWSDTEKHLFKLFRRGAGGAIDPLPVLLDPYFVGLLLGDGGLTQEIRLCNNHPEILKHARAIADMWRVDMVPDRDPNDTSCSWRFTAHGRGNRLRTHLRALGVFPSSAATKRVPGEYLYNDLDVRLQILAGLLDTDGAISGGGFDYVSKSEQLARDVAYLVRSVALAAYVTPCTKRWQHGEGQYWRVSISGDCWAIPTRVKRAPRRQQKKDVLRTGFDVELLGVADYYGFTLDGDGRYLLDDFTVTHNSGKTECGIALTRVFPCRWLFLVHRSTLLNQCAKRYELRTGLTAGRIGAGKWEPEPFFTVATLQTLYRNLDGRAGELLRQVDGIIVDECHTSAASSFLRTINRTTSAYYRYGLSATPLARGDRKNILVHGALGPVIYRVKPERLIEAGAISRPKIIMVPLYQDSERQTWEGVYRECVVRSKERNELIARSIDEVPKPALVFVKEIKHGRRLLRMLERAGHNARFVWGTDSESARDTAVEQLQRGDIDVLICSVIFQEGVDIPNLRSVIVAAGGKSTIAALQRIGRGMRVTEDKTEVVVIDIADSGHRWLERHTKERTKAYKKEGYKVKVLAA